MKAFDKSIYIARRKVLKERLGSGQILLFGNQETGINFKDNWYHFRQDSTLLYYTGIDIANVHVLLDLDTGDETLFGHELTIDDVVWTGPLPSLGDLARRAGMNKTASLNKLKNAVQKDVRFLPAYRQEHVTFLADLLDKSPNEIGSLSSHEFIMAVIDQRNIKEQREIDQMNLAVHFSYDMHKAVMKASTPGIYEHNLVGAASKMAYKHNVSFAYPAILTKRGEVLHNHDHSGKLLEEDIVLYDGGCESQMYYAGDITRTFPVDGQWTTLQKEMYDVVYESYRVSAAALQPNVQFREIHLLAAQALVKGLKALGFMKGDVDEAVSAGAHTMFFQCGLGHMIGLDVHDMENLGEHLVGYRPGLEKSKEFGLKSLRLGRELEEGFALTIEPGIYIIPTLIDLRKSQGAYLDFINYEMLNKHRDFGGIRLEDNFVITQHGSEIIGFDPDMPTTSKEVSDFMV